jgi:hypothetical protein
MKRSIFLFTLFVAVAAAGTAQIGLRNISSLSADLYFNDEEAAVINGGSLEKLSLDLNQVVLFRLTNWLSGEIKIQRQDEEPFASAAPEGWHETTISIAPIFIVSQYNYIIARYGLGIGTGYERPAGDQIELADIRGLSHDMTVDANYETARFLASLTFRGSLYPDLNYWFVVPSAGIRYVFPVGMGLSGKYFFSYNSQAAVSHAFLSEVEFPVSDRVSLKVGGSGSMTPTRPIETRWQYTAIAGVSYRVTETLGLKYHVEYLGRQNAGPGIRNLVVLDARF